MPMINIEDAYILDETGAQVDQVTGLYFKNENASDTEKAQARANIGAGGSNDNLLDNAYFVGGGSQLGDNIFPINQRGQTQYTAAGFVFDRWFKSGGVTATLDAGGLTIANSNGWPDGVKQRFPMHFFAQMNGEAITASVLYEDGTIDSGTAVIDATQNYQWLKYPEAGEIGFQLKNFQDGAAYDYFDYISFGAGANSTPKKIKKFKLEKGTVSTLANDAPPDFVTELAKCKSNFQRVKQPQGYTAPIGFGIIGASSNILRTLIPLSSPLRDATSITASATNIGQMKVWGNGSYFTPSAITGRTVLNGHAVVDITVSGSLQNYMVYHIILEDASTYIDLSAEL